jgi:magnesium transporter
MKGKFYELSEKISGLIEKGASRDVKNLLEDLHPADIAEMLVEMDAEKDIKILRVIGHEKAGAVLYEIEPARRAEILNMLNPQFISDLMESIPSEEAADIFWEMPEDKAEKALRLMEDEEAEGVEALLKHPPDSAGGIMTPDVFALESSVKVEDAINALRKTEGMGNVSYLYVVDRERRLDGVISLKDLITADGAKSIGEIMRGDVIYASVDMDQEEVARLVRKYNLRSLPVVDRRGVLIGRVTADDVMDVIQEEADEDILRMAGIDDDARLEGKTVAGIAWFRLPWLVPPLAAGLAAAYIIKGFEEMLEQIIAISFFMPVIMGMGGNVGTQSAAIVVRGIAVGRIDLGNIWNLLFKELRVAMIMGAVCGALTGILGIVMHGNAVLGIVVAASMFLALSISSTIGAFLPAVLKRFNIDPAIASGPFVTTINDIVGLLIYFLMASGFIAYL